MTTTLQRFINPSGCTSCGCCRSCYSQYDVAQMHMHGMVTSTRAFLGPMLNQQRCRMRLQVTQLERAMNVLVFVQFSLLVLFSAVLAVLDQVWTSGNIPANWYLQSLNKWPELAPGGLGWLVSVSNSRLAMAVLMQKTKRALVRCLSFVFDCVPTWRCKS